MTIPRCLGTIPVVSLGRCSGCGRCVAACPRHLFTLEPAGWRKVAVINDPARCDNCGRCFKECPVKALGDAQNVNCS